MQKATVLIVFAFIIAAFGQANTFPYCQTSCAPQCADPAVCSSSNRSSTCECVDPTKVCGICSTPNCPSAGICVFAQSPVDKSYNCVARCPPVTPTCGDVTNCTGATPLDAGLNAPCPEGLVAPASGRYACVPSGTSCSFKDLCAAPARTCDLKTCDLATNQVDLTVPCPRGTELPADKTTRYTCLPKGTDCYWFDQCVNAHCNETCNNATLPSDPKCPADTTLPSGIADRYACVNEGQGCYYKDQCVPVVPPKCDLKCNGLRFPDLNPNCPDGTLPANGRFTCDLTTCTWKDQCPPAVVCDTTTCKGAIEPTVGRSTACPEGQVLPADLKERFTCVGTPRGCAWVDQCRIAGFSCEIQAANDQKICGDGPLPPCPGGYSQTACVQNGTKCDWKIVCRPYCGPDSCGPKPNCTNTKEPECIHDVLTGECSWYPGCLEGTPCTDCPPPCKAPQIRLGGSCRTTDAATKTCAWASERCVDPTPVTCDCTEATVFPCPAGTVADISVALKCAPIPGRFCERNCIPNTYCLTKDPCTTDYTKCYFLECMNDKYRSLTGAYTIFEAKEKYNTLFVEGANLTIYTERPAKCPTKLPPIVVQSPIEKLEASTTDTTTVKSATDSFKETYDQIKNSVDAETGTSLFSDFVPFVLAIKSNGLTTKPSVDVTVQLIPVTGVAVTQAHLDAFCKLLVKTVFPIVTKYTEKEFTSCSLTKIASQKRQVTGTSSNLYTATALPSDSAVDRVYGSSSGSAAVYYSVGMLVPLIALYLL